MGTGGRSETVRKSQQGDDWQKCCEFIKTERKVAISFAVELQRCPAVTLDCESVFKHDYISRDQGGNSGSR